MVNPLIFLHAGLGEAGAIAFLWVLVESLGLSEPGLRRARIAARIGLICLFGAWIFGGYYYVSVYGAEIKPAIVGSEAPWIHGLVMELKEHLFLFLPVLAILITILLNSSAQPVLEDPAARRSVSVLSGLIALFGFSIAGMGALIAAGYRFAILAGVA